jgi:hypothetical protein
MKSNFTATNTKKFWVQFVFFTFLLAFFTPAFSQEFDPDNDDYFDDEEEFVPTWPDDELYPEQSVPIQNPEIISVARFKTYAHAYIRFDHTSSFYHSSYFYLDNNRGGTQSLNLSNRGDVVLKNLPINETYSIIYSNGIDGAFVVGTLSTFERAETTHEVELADTRYDDLSRYFENPPEGIDLYTFVCTRTDWHPIEMISFMQEYIYFGRELDDPVDDSVIPDDPFDPTDLGDPVLSEPGDPTNWIRDIVPNPYKIEYGDNGFGNPEISKPECICRPLTLQIHTKIEPFEGAIFNGHDGIFHNVWGGITDPSNSGANQPFGDNGRMWHSYGMKGPGKYVQAWMFQRRCDRGITYINSLSTSQQEQHGTGTTYPHTVGNAAIIKYTWACADADGLVPDNCMCESDIRLRLCYRYNTQVSAFTNFRIPDLVTENWAIQPMIRKI